ncbi:hypothetical protein [Kribbella sp. CA-293567]|uniref:hypothetical protein n=1 Tax=Kribbella sp. CA-293567 TaxID=3002436 RepID=UPI0022DCF81C|nr:hypothetical protein [Kribbella sp. CA-293567]WBQ06092.1 hypothetical protein OX958_04625 [Kribbella sp. CA-293567]
MVKPLRSKAMLASAMSLMTCRRRTSATEVAAADTAEPPSTPYVVSRPVDLDTIADRAPTSYSLIGW